MRKLEVSVFDMTDGFMCPVCNKPYTPNGTGPANNKWLTRLLKMLPSNSAVGGLPPRFHDIAFLLCPKGYRISFNFGGELFVAYDFDSANNAYYNLMKRQIKDHVTWSLRGVCYFFAWRNYTAVDKFGKKSYKHKH